VTRKARASIGKGEIKVGELLAEMKERGERPD
jgi:hypothetical protein